jgi:hypothetical protein
LNRIGNVAAVKTVTTAQPALAALDAASAMKVDAAIMRVMCPSYSVGRGKGLPALQNGAGLSSGKHSRHELSHSAYPNFNCRRAHERSSSQSIRSTHPTQIATSGTAAATNEPRSQPRRCRTQPRTAPTTNQSGIDRIADDASQTHTFCSLPGASKAMTAVMRASGAVTQAPTAQAAVSTISMMR